MEVQRLSVTIIHSLLCWKHLEGRHIRGTTHNENNQIGWLYPLSEGSTTFN
jgi:hypothetical protein